MYLSKIIRTSNNIYIYDALNNSFVTIDSEENISDDIKYAEFLNNTGFRDIKEPCEFTIKYPYSEEELSGMFVSKVKSVTLALTEQCNLRCKYCGYMAKYQDANYALKEMPKEIAFKAIDILMKNSHESDLCHLSFYGGEPLLRLDLIKECIAYVAEKYPFRQPTYNITTNAVLLDDNVTDFIIENGIKVNLSFDGPKKDQNKYRVDGNENSSYDKVHRNILAFYHKNPKFFRENVTYNVVMFNGASNELFESVDSLWKLDVNMIDLFPTEYFMRVKEEKEVPEKSEQIDITAYDFAYKSMLKGMKKYYNSFSGTGGSNIIFPGGFCVPGVRKNFITTDGRIIVCEKVDESQKVFEIGDVHNGVDINKIRRLVDETQKRLEKCKHCWAAKFCKICYKDIFIINDGFCETMKKSIEGELGYYFDQVSNDRGLVNYVANISLI